MSVRQSLKMRLLLFLIFGLIGSSLCLSNYDSVISAARAGTLYRKVNRELGKKNHDNFMIVFYINSNEYHI